MLGIGLGGFASGFERGVGLGDRMQKAGRERENQRGIDEAVKGGQSDHEAAVTAGKAKAGDADSILRFTMPRLVLPMMKSGDLNGAQAASEWLRSDTTRAATKAWGEGMLLAQTGDTAGALKKFVAAGRTKGYGPDFEISEPQPTEGGGFRVDLKSPDGRSFSKEFKGPDDVIKFGAAYLNPEAAFKSSQDQQAEARKQQAELDTYGKKKTIDIASDEERRRLNLPPGGRSSDQPADVKAAEWLMQNKVAPNLPAAWEMVRRSRENPDAIRAQIFGRAISPAIGQKNWEAYLNAGDRPQAPGLGGSGNLTGPGKTITGVQVQSQGIPAPRDPAQRKVGQVYAAPDGRNVQWTGKGWMVVP
jgi:hypothetical protein